MANESDRLLLRITEAAERLAVGRSTVYELIGAGELPVIHIGRAVRIPAAAVRNWVERQADELTPSPAA